MKRSLPPVLARAEHQPLAPSPCVTAEPYALRVTDDSLAPEFAVGTVVIVDPSLAAEQDDYVVASIDGSVTLCRFKSTPEGVELRVRDRSWLASRCHIEILGVVVQRAGRRRSAHKHYRTAS